MWGRILLAAILPVLWPAAGSAQYWPRECRSDIARTCREAAKIGDRDVVVCLQTNEQKVSRGCRKLLQSYGYLPK